MNFAEAPEWIPIFPKPGTFQSPRYGEIKITTTRLARFVDNFNGKIYQKHIPIDVEHETKLSGALGYITELRSNEDGGVDGRAEWTDRGVSILESGRFKYISPEWFDEWQDPATQENHIDVLIGAALTTRPFFKDNALRPLFASEGGLELSDNEVIMKCGTIEEMRTRGAIYAEIDARAKQMREADPKLTEAAAVAKVIDSDAQLYREYAAAPYDDAQPALADVPDGYQFGATEKIVAEQIEKKAREYMGREPALTIEQARVKVFAEFPESVERYRRAREVDRLAQKGR